MYRPVLAFSLLCLLSAAAVGDEDQEEKIKTCIRRLDPDVNVTYRRQAASDLAGYGADAKAAIPALRKALEKDTDVKVRQLSAFALKQMGGEAGKAAVPSLIAALKNDKDSDVRIICANACANYGKAAKDAVS